MTPRCTREEGVAVDVIGSEPGNVESAFIDGEEEGFAAIYTWRGGGEIVRATPVAAALAK